jgi:hypothetical protein
MYMICLGCMRTGATDAPGGTTLGMGENKLTFVMGDTGLGLHGHCHGSAISMENCTENCGDLHYECPEYQRAAKSRCFTHPAEYGLDKCRLCHDKEACDSANDRYARSQEGPFTEAKYCEKCYKKATGEYLATAGWGRDEDDFEIDSKGLIRMREIGIMAMTRSRTPYYRIAYECPKCGDIAYDFIDEHDALDAIREKASFNALDFPIRNRNYLVMGNQYVNNAFVNVRIGVDSLNSVTDIISAYNESNLAATDKVVRSLLLHYIHLKLDMLNELERRQDEGDEDAKAALDAYKLDCYYRGVKYSDDKNSLYRSDYDDE